MLYFVVRSQIAVRAAITDDDVRALLGPVDAPGDAWFWLMRDTGQAAFACGRAEQSAYRAVPDGFELRSRGFTSACNPRTEALITYHVGRDGHVREVGRAVLRNQPDGCVVP